MHNIDDPDLFRREREASKRRPTRWDSHTFVPDEEPLDVTPGMFKDRFSWLITLVTCVLILVIAALLGLGIGELFRWVF